MPRSWTSLKRRADFLRIGRSGLKQVTPAFILQAAMTEPESPRRIGFTASRKLGDAVTRNRAKRRLRAAADEALKGFDLGAAFDYVLIGRAAVLDRDFEVIVRELQSAMTRLSRSGTVKRP